MKLTALWLAVLTTGCFDSLVDSPCNQGELSSHGTCVLATVTPPDAPLDGPRDAATDATLDAPLDAPPDAPPMVAVDATDAEPVTPDAFVCTADTVTDPVNCGECGTHCATGLCSDSRCVGTTRGHVVGIGHDYRLWNAAMDQVLANAIELGGAGDLAIARWTGSATVVAATAVDTAVSEAMRTTHHAWHPAPLPTSQSADAFADLDVIVVDPQSGDGDAIEAAATSWRPAFGTFVANGGVVVVLESPQTASYRFAAGANLYSFGAPGDVTGEPGYVIGGTDAVAQSVLSPYRAEPSSVALPAGVVPAVVATSDGRAIVFHLAY